MAGGVDVIEVKVNRQIYVYLPMMQGKAVVMLNGIDELILSESDGAFVTDFDKDDEQGPLGR